MESVFRGFVEKELDDMLKQESLQNMISYSKEFPLKTVEDFCLGVIVGFIITTAVAEGRIRYGRDPSNKEMLEALNMVERRTMEIGTATKMAINK